MRETSRADATASSYAMRTSSLPQTAPTISKRSPAPAPGMRLSSARSSTNSDSQPAGRHNSSVSASCLSHDPLLWSEFTITSTMKIPFHEIKMFIGDNKESVYKALSNQRASEQAKGNESVTFMVIVAEIGLMSMNTLILSPEMSTT